MKTYRLIRFWLMNCMKWSVILVMTSMALTVIWQVLSRYIDWIPATATEELAAILMMATGLFGAVIGFERKAHLGIDILAQIVDEPSQKIMNITVWLLVIVFAGTLLIWGGTLMVNEAIARGNMLNSLPHISRAWVYLPMPVSGAFIVWIAVENLIHLFFGIDLKGDANTQEAC